MDKKRFVAFRSDLVKLKDLIVEKTAEEVEKILDELVVAYPELHTHEDSLPELSVKRGGKEQCSQKRDDIKKSSLRVSAVRGLNSEVKVVKDNEETCLETLRELDNAMRDSRRRIIYFSCLQGEVLKRLLDICGKKMPKSLRMTTFSKSQAYFLIKLYELADKFNAIIKSTLPIRFFNLHFKTIAEICESEGDMFK